MCLYDIRESWHQQQVSLLKWRVTDYFLSRVIKITKLLRQFVWEIENYRCFRIKKIRLVGKIGHIYIKETSVLFVINYRTHVSLKRLCYLVIGFQILTETCFFETKNLRSLTSFCQFGKNNSVLFVLSTFQQGQL